jgi:hypothetical protein
MSDQSEPKLKSKSRFREVAIVLAAFVIACVVGLAIRTGIVDPAGSGRADVAAK